VHIAGASLAGAACTPIYNDLPPNQGQLLGCCDANGNLKPAGANCINPNNICQEGDCTAAGVCGPKADGDFNKTNSGDDCHVPGFPCLVGTCQTQSCNDAVPVCNDGNPCTTDPCDLNTSTPQYPWDVTCGTPVPSSGNFCGITNGTDTCTRGTCDSGSCTPTATTDTCDDPAGECKVAKCAGYDANQVKLCVEENLDEFTPCNVGAWTQCMHHECSSGGNCRNDPQNGAVCNPTPCTQRQCDNGGNCDDGTLVNLPDGTACPDNNTQCKIDQCINGTCDHGANTAAGTPCFQLNPCKLSECNGTGGCGVPNAAVDGQSCSVFCTESGTCAGGTCDAITCKPNTTPCNVCGAKCNPTPPPGVTECTCG
jgi:hypothetical protein